jgi:hypothetical protein
MLTRSDVGILGNLHIRNEVFKNAKGANNFDYTVGVLHEGNECQVLSMAVLASLAPFNDYSHGTCGRLCIEPVRFLSTFVLHRSKIDTLIYDQRVVVAWTGQFRSRFNELPICTSRARKFRVSHGSRSAQDCVRFREVWRWAVCCGELRDGGLRASKRT